MTLAQRRTDTAFERLVSLLEPAGGLRLKAGHADARCPAHDDNAASLTVDINREANGVVVNCHAGCATTAVVDALGLQMRDLYDAPRDSAPRNSQVIAEYEYVDEAGKLLFVVERRSPKTFRQRVPDGHGGWLWKLGETRRVLYRLPEVLQAVAEGRQVYYVEGEKDADRLRCEGHVATCNPMGAGNWRLEYAESLRGGYVTVVTDNDKPGRQHAVEVADALIGVAANVQLMQPVSGKDVSDHLDAGHALGDLVEFDDSTLADDTLPAPEATPGTTDRGSRFVTGEQFILDQPGTVPIVWGHDDQVAWAEGEALMLVGPAGVGKSTLGQQLVLGRLGLIPRVLGLTVQPGTKRVLYLACDRPPQIARSLGRMVRPEHRDALRDRLVVWKGPPPADFAKQPDTLLEMARSAGADTVIIDSLKDVALGLVDDEVGAAYNNARQAALVEGIQILELHHQTKRGGGGVGKPNTLADVYGSVWITAGAGSVMLLWGQAGDSVVELLHLKQPAEEIGPHKVLHDHHAGETSLYGASDPLQILRAEPGITAPGLARLIFVPDGTRQPKPNEIEKARRQLDRLVDKQLATRIDGSRGGPNGGQQARYFPTAPEHLIVQEPTP